MDQLIKSIAERKNMDVPTKFDHGDCAAFRKDSLKCLMDNHENKERCKEYFDRYNACNKNRKPAPRR